MRYRRTTARAVRRRARESLWMLVAIAALVGVGLVVARAVDRRDAPPPVSVAPGRSTAPVRSPASPPSPSPAAAGRAPARAQRLVVAFTRDGDTLEANAVAGAVPVPTTDRIVIRLLGIDAPETHGASGQPQCYSRDAYHALQRLTPNGSTIWVVADAQLHDQYERYLLYVWNARGVFVNDELARGGYARSLDIRPNLARQKQLDASVAEARRERRGLWGRCVSR